MLLLFENLGIYNFTSTSLHTECPLICRQIFEQAANLGPYLRLGFIFVCSTYKEWQCKGICSLHDYMTMHHGLYMDENPTTVW